MSDLISRTEAVQKATEIIGDDINCKALAILGMLETLPDAIGEYVPVDWDGKPTLKSDWFYCTSTGLKRGGNEV